MSEYERSKWASSTTTTTVPRMSVGITFSRKEALELMEAALEIASQAAPTYTTSRARVIYQALKRELAKE